MTSMIFVTSWYSMGFNRRIVIVDVQVLCEHWAKVQKPGHLRTAGVEEWFNSIVQEVQFQEVCRSYPWRDRRFRDHHLDDRPGAAVGLHPIAVGILSGLSSREQQVCASVKVEGYWSIRTATLP